jgi:aminoglycoside phosphotransferase family enzyme/predicted kinase
MPTHATGDQSEVIAFLSKPDSYGEPGPVTRIETHISIVFLVGRMAFKLKRAVCFPYLDFSSVESRRRACLDEISVNRRTAAPLYRTVHAIFRDSSGQLSFSRDGNAIVDWVVEMVRFDNDCLFDRMARANMLGPEAIETTAEIIAGFHADADIAPAFGGYDGINAILSSNAQCFADLTPAIFERNSVERLNEAARAALERNAVVLEARRQCGAVRHCHGDLHLRNIVMYEGVPTLFDAIEFSPVMARIDALYDLSFMLMDLECRGHFDLASLAFNRYCDSAPAPLADERAFALLPLFLSIRAAVRAHVAGAAQGANVAADAGAPDALTYFRIASRYLLPAAPRLVAIGGLSGSGKSLAARKIAPSLRPAPGGRVLRSDVARKRLLGRHSSERLGSDGYEPQVTARTYADLYHRAVIALRAGQSVIVDAVFADAGERAAIAAVAATAGVKFDAVWLEASPDTLVRRVASRRNDVSDATPAVVARQLDYDLGTIAWPRIDAGGSADQTVARIAETIG